MAPALDKIRYIIRSCIVFSLSNCAGAQADLHLYCLHHIGIPVNSFCHDTAHI